MGVITAPGSDLDLEHWRDYEDILTDSLWLIPKRDTSGGHAGSTSYHGGFVAQIPQQLIRRFTKPGDVVLDLFAGWGTTAICAKELGRHSFNVDLSDEATNDAQRRLDALPNPHRVEAHFYQADATEDIRWLRMELYCMTGRLDVDLTILHPPYADIVKFSDNPLDLSNLPVDEFYMSLGMVAHQAKTMTRRGGHVALVIGDCYKKGKVEPLGFRCMQILADTGLVLKGIIVKDIQGNEKGSGGKNKNLWRYRHLKNGTFGFSHEYLFLFRNDV